MRIVGGSLSGRRLNPPANKWPTRPTTDYAREALFNILHQQIDWEATKMLDLFGGTGAISIEAISRGCEDVTYVERYFPCVQFVKKMIAEFKIVDSIKVLKQDVFKLIKTSQEGYDFIFADPPYDHKLMPQIPAMILNSKLLNPVGILVVEHPPQISFKEVEGFTQERKYGSSVFSFFEHIPANVRNSEE